FAIAIEDGNTAIHIQFTLFSAIRAIPRRTIYKRRYFLKLYWQFSLIRSTRRSRQSKSSRRLLFFYFWTKTLPFPTITVRIAKLTCKPINSYQHLLMGFGCKNSVFISVSCRPYEDGEEGKNSNADKRSY